MADTFLSLASRMPGQTSLTLIDGGTATGYRMLTNPAWSAPQWDTRYSGARGTQGARAAGGDPQNRILSVPLRIEGTTTDGMFDLYSDLARKAEEVRRFGGILTWRAQGASHRVYWDLMSGATQVGEWRARTQHSGLLDVALDAVTAPYALGDPLDVLDTFAAESVTKYTKDAFGGEFVISGGQLVPQGTGTARWRHTDTGHLYTDVQATMRAATGTAITNFRFEIFICAKTDGEETYLFAAIDPTLLHLGTRSDGTVSTLTSASHTLSASSAYWLRVRRQGPRLFAEVFTNEPSPMATPTASLSLDLTAAQESSYRFGHCGFRPTVVSTAERYDSFAVEAFSYRNLTLPEELKLDGHIPGDAPALCDLTVTPSGGSAAPIWALFGWAPRVPVWNQVWNGDFEEDTNGWSVAAVSGVTGAATSIDRSTTVARTRYGGANGSIVCPATANTGATFAIYRRFRAGRRYLLLLWASSASQTTATRCRLGVSGDIASETAAALTTLPALRSVVWTPTADREVAYACFEVTAATSTAMNIDGVIVCEPRVTALAADMSASSSGLAVSSNPPDLPTAPFVALIGSELVLVTNASTVNWSVARGVEGTTAATHNSGTAVYVLPEFQHQREGKGGAPPLGIIEAEADDSGNRFTWVLDPHSSARVGNRLRTSVVTGAGSVASDYLVDPHLLVPDDYTQGEVAVEVWARIQLDSGLANPVAILATAPETATVASGLLSSSWGQVRYSDEHGSSGRPLTRPSLGNLYRFCRLGTVRFIVDRARPQRWRLQVRLTHAAGTSAARWALDYLVLVPASARAVSPTLKPNDSAYPRFIASTSETSKTILADLSGRVQKVGASPHPDHGLGGSLLEIPYGTVDGLLKLSSLVADDPTSDQTDEQLAHSTTVRLSVTPRFALARGSS